MPIAVLKAETFTSDKSKKQNLGIYYTDQRIVDFIYDILLIWKEKEDKELRRWESRKPYPHYPSVIDPACGEGIFLKRAIEKGFTGYHPEYKVPYVFGIDIDGDAVRRWEEVSLLELFNGDRKVMQNHFYCQNGLLGLPDRKLPYKKGEDSLMQYDAAVGNPPYGGVGLEKTELTDELVTQLAKFEILPESIKDNLSATEHQTSFLQSEKAASIKPDAVNRIKSFPIEILFMERFIQLTKPGGWIAIIIPDGILTNSNSHYVREFIADKTKVEAIVSLPRDAFKHVGTSAKTSILFMQKLKPDDEKRELDYPVFLASIENLEEENFKSIVEFYKKYYLKI